VSIYVFTKNDASLQEIFPKTAKFFPIEALSEHTPEDGNLSYINISGITPAEIDKVLTKFKKICKDTPWGIIDPKGNIKDTAALFFDGASDYLGSGVFKETGSLNPKRIKQAVQWRKELAANTASAKEVSSNETQSGGFLNAGIKLPSASAFPGWKKMQTGKVMPFYLLYCSLQGKISLDDRFDSKTVANIHKRFLSCLEDNFHEGEGLLWMNTGRDCLFLIPPKVKCAEEAVKACIRVLISAPLITLETLNLAIPVNFIFALHYGTVSYKPPGHTGTVVSDAVNYVFHLGGKKAESGRLTVSSELPGVTIPSSLYDCFTPAGEFDGRKVWQTKKFSYAKPWF
jgi:hypothetical protein